MEIERLLDRVELVGVVERAGGRLRRKGRRWTGACPLHGGENQGAFSVYEGEDGRERWYCFTDCQAGGDAIDFVSRWQNLGFRDAVKWLAEMVGMSLEELGWTAEGAKREVRRRELGDLRRRAAEYYQGRFWDAEAPAGKVAREYVAGRGWTEETMKAVGLGLADGRLHEKAQAVGVSLEDLWRAGLVSRDGERYWDAIPAGYLVYVHRRGRRVEFMAGRAIWELVDPDGRLDEEGRKARKARNLDSESGETPRRAFWVGPIENADRQNERILVVCEGQADGVTWAQAGCWAAALAGGSADEGLVGKIKRWRGRVVLGLDTDEAGLEFVRRLMGRGLHPLTQVVRTWPGGATDANEALVVGLEEVELEVANQALLDSVLHAPEWLGLEILRVARGERRERPELMKELFGLLAQLNNFELEVWREGVLRGVPDLTPGAFTRFLAAAKKEAAGGEGASGGSWAGRYAIEEGRLCQVRQGDGGRQLLPLCNFAARVVADVARDDGEEIERVFELEGALDTGQKLASYQVEARDFGKMDWVTDAWGVRAILRAGRGMKDKVREALQLQSLNAPTTRVYTHTGWRVVDGERVFLTASGGLGAKSAVQVDLDDQLKRYALPREAPSAEEIRAGMTASLRFLVVGLWEVTAPLWAGMWLAPLAEVLEPAFVTWVYGPTGTLKSTLAALALNHFGDFTDRSLPAAWADTAVSLELRMFASKDVPLVIDDFAPAATSYDARLLEKNAAQVVRGVGNRSGRGRGTRDVRQRRVFRPRGLVISTGEQLPGGQSIAARLVTVEMERGSVDRERLTVAQGERGLYAAGMAGFLGWVNGQWDELGETLLEARQDLRARAREEGEHLRLPEALANLYIGLDLGLAYAGEMGVLDAGQVDEWRARGWEALIGLVRSQAERVLLERPAMRFLAVIGELLAQGKAFLAPLGDPGKDGPKVGSELVGYYDEDGVYLLSEASYRMVVQREREGGSHFPEKQRTLYRNLAQAGMVTPGVESGRMTTVVEVGGRSVRTLRLAAAAEEWVARPEEPPAEEEMRPLMPEVFG